MMKKSRKGMTLIEIVVSIAIYGVLALLLVEIMSLVNTTIRATDALNKRLAYESKFADNQLTAGIDSSRSEAANITIDYGDASSGTFVSAASHHVAVDDAMLWRAEYTDANHSNVGAQADFRFMVIGRNAFIPSVQPDHPFYLEVTVDSAIYSITNGAGVADTITSIVIGGKAIDATYAIDPMNPQVLLGTPNDTSIDPTTTPYTEITPPNPIVLDPAILPSNHAQDFTIRIPVNYHYGNFEVDSSTGEKYLNPETVTVTFNMRRIGELSGNAYDYPYVTLTLNYKSCQPDHLPDGTDTVNYFREARYEVYADGHMTPVSPP